MSTKSNRNHKKGERDVGRLFLRRGYTAWRTAQNRQSTLDDESDDVSANLVPEHARCKSDGTPDRYGMYLDPYYFDRDNHPEKGQVALSIDKDFDPVSNLTIEVKNGYNDAKTYTSQFKKWVKKLKRETPEGNVWALFWRRNYAPRYCYRLCYEQPTNSGLVRVITTRKEDTMRAIDHVVDLARAASL